MSVTTTDSPTRTITLPRAPWLVGTLYAVCVVLPLLIFVGIILFTDKDPHASEGPIASLESIGLVGHIGLLLGVAIALATRARQRAAAGSIALAVLSVVTVVFFWSGAPGILGACAAWRAGLTRGGTSLTGAGRVAGLVGLFVAGLNIVLTLGGFALALTGLS
jgi:hypothetical protein